MIQRPAPDQLESVPPNAYLIRTFLPSQYDKGVIKTSALPSKEYTDKPDERDYGPSFWVDGEDVPSEGTIISRLRAAKPKLKKCGVARLKASDLKAHGFTFKLTPCDCNLPDELLVSAHATIFGIDDQSKRDKLLDLMTQSIIEPPQSD